MAKDYRAPDYIGQRQAQLAVEHSLPHLALQKCSSVSLHRLEQLFIRQVPVLLSGHSDFA
jgi:hypothetical protein